MEELDTESSSDWVHDRYDDDDSEWTLCAVLTSAWLMCSQQEGHAEVADEAITRSARTEAGAHQKPART